MSPIFHLIYNIYKIHSYNIHIIYIRFMLEQSTILTLITDSYSINPATIFQSFSCQFYPSNVKNYLHIVWTKYKKILLVCTRNLSFPILNIYLKYYKFVLFVKIRRRLKCKNSRIITRIRGFYVAHSDSKCLVYSVPHSSIMVNNWTLL